MVRCRILEGAVMSVVVANAKNSDVLLWLVIRIVVIDVVKICADTSGFAHAAHASIFHQQRSLKRIGDMLPWHGIHPRRIDSPQPNAAAHLRGGRRAAGLTAAAAGEAAGSAARSALPNQAANEVSGS